MRRGDGEGVGDRYKWKGVVGEDFGGGGRKHGSGFWGVGDGWTVTGVFILKWEVGLGSGLRVWTGLVFGMLLGNNNFKGPVGCRYEKHKDPICNLWKDKGLQMKLSHISYKDQ